MVGDWGDGQSWVFLVQGLLHTGFFLSAALLGLAGGLHCVGMCGAVGGVLCGGAQRPAFRWWNVARVVSYGAAGAVLGGGAQWLLGLGQRVPALHAVWVMVQFGALAVALLMLLAPGALGWRGLAGQGGWMPVTLHALGRQGDQGAVVRAAGRPGPVWGAVTGLMWAGFPCGLLHGALLMAWLSGSAASGTLVMVLFGSASAAWLLTGAALVDRLRQSGVLTETGVRRVTGGVLLASWVWMAVALWMPGVPGLSGSGVGGSGAWGLSGWNGMFCSPVR